MACNDCSGKAHPCHKHSACIIKGRIAPSKCKSCIQIYCQLLKEEADPNILTWWKSRINNLSQRLKHRIKGSAPIDVWATPLDRRTFGSIFDMPIQDAAPLLEDYLPEDKVLEILQGIEESSFNLKKAFTALTSLGQGDSEASFVLPSSISKTQEHLASSEPSTTELLVSQ